MCSNPRDRPPLSKAQCCFTPLWILHFAIPVSTHFVHTVSLCSRVLYSHQLHFGCCIMSTMAAILGSQWFHTPLRLGSRATIGSMLTDHVALQSTLTAQCITTFSTGTASYDQQCSNLPSHVTIDQAALQSKWKTPNVARMSINSIFKQTNKTSNVTNKLCLHASIEWKAKNNQPTMLWTPKYKSWMPKS